jgi:hypothetical protein
MHEPLCTLRRPCVQHVVHKLLKMLKQFATVWQQVSSQLQASTRAEPPRERLADRKHLPDLSDEMVRLALFWVRTHRHAVPL